MLARFTSKEVGHLVETISISDNAASIAVAAVRVLEKFSIIGGSELRLIEQGV